MNITNDIRYIGVNDHKVDLFEGQYKVPAGMAYNSYAIIDDEIAIMDTVDANFTHEWLDNIEAALGGRKPDYLVVQHMEPDHSANIVNFTKAYPNAMIVSSSKAFAMMKHFFGTDFEDKQIIIEDMRLRVNLDGNTPSRIKEVKTYQWEKGWKKTPAKYINQTHVQVWGSWLSGMEIEGADIVAYGLEAADYDNFLRELDPGRLKEIPVSYDPGWLEKTYLPKHMILCDCLKRGVFPYV